MTFSPECTFLPRRHPHEITDRKRGEALVKRINRWMAKTLHRQGVFMVAKLDPHHNVYQPNETWLVEICPFTSFETDWLDRKDPDHRPFMRSLRQLFKGMRERFDLVPSLITRRGGVDYHQAGGGNHVHLSASIYNMDASWYQRMEAFHRNLAIDYANRPYARWLLSHWIGGGHHNLVTRDQLSSPDLLTEDYLFGEMAYGACAIESRFMGSAKNSYLTWEFRIVGMVDNPHQLRAAVLLCKAWMESIRCGPKRTFTLTTKQWDRYTTIRGAKAACRAWVEELGLKWADYDRDFFQRNYRLRIENRKFD